jgi:hypothetical protein
VHVSPIRSHREHLVSLSSSRRAVRSHLTLLFRHATQTIAVGGGRLPTEPFCFAGASDSSMGVTHFGTCFIQSYVLCYRIVPPCEYSVRRFPPI